MAEFWSMTPYETELAIEASEWRSERLQRFNLKLAWDMAMLSRQKRIPSLKSLLSARPTRPLQGAALQKSRSDFKAMASTSNVDLINAAMKKRVNK